MPSLDERFEELERKRRKDLLAYQEHDPDVCMLCGAEGQDKRSLFMRCFYDLKEAVPEFLDLQLVKGMEINGYYLRICKACRGRLLANLRLWAGICRTARFVQKDHDGNMLGGEGDIPVRVNGAITMMTREQWDEYRKLKDG